MTGQRGRMAAIIRAMYGKEPDEIIPKLMREHKTPYNVATALKVYPNAVRFWLISNGWKVTNGTWRAPENGEV